MAEVRYELRSADGRWTAAPDRETALAWAAYEYQGVGAAGEVAIAVCTHGWQTITPNPYKEA